MNFFEKNIIDFIVVGFDRWIILWIICGMSDLYFFWFLYELSFDWIIIFDLSLGFRYLGIKVGWVVIIFKKVRGVLFL